MPANDQDRNRRANLETKERLMSTPATTVDTEALPDYAPVPRSALGPALNEQGY
jgi:hypothetical protein